MHEAIKLRLSSNVHRLSCETCSLSELCVTHGLTNDELLEFEKAVILSPHLKKDSYLYRTGEPLQAIYAIKSGSFKGTVSDADGNIHITGFFTPGEVIGFDGLAENQYQCNLVAMEDSRVCELPIEKFDVMCQQFPKLQRETQRINSRKQNSLQQLLMLIGKRPVEERVAMFLLNMMEQYRRRNINIGTLHLPMSRHEIANYLGMAPETLSRQLKQFQAERWITITNKNCAIIDEDALRTVANICNDNLLLKSKLAG